MEILNNIQSSIWKHNMKVALFSICEALSLSHYSTIKHTLAVGLSPLKLS